MDLLRKQRANFTAVTTIIAAILLLIILGCAFVMVFETTNMSTRNALDKALYTRNPNSEIPQQSTRGFYVYINASGNPNVKDDLSYYGSSAEVIVAKTCEVKEGRFKVDHIASDRHSMPALVALSGGPDGPAVSFDLHNQIMS